MRQRGRVGLPIRDILMAGFTARGADAWHAEPGPGGRWSWHASALSGCPRAQVLKRAKAADDGLRLESLLTFEVGHAYHRLLEESAAAYANVAPSFKVIGAEVGGHHPTLPLAARADLIYSIDGVPMIADWKTESAFAAKHRRQESEGGTSAKPEHQLQLAATAMVAEALGLVDGVIESGWIGYIEKEKGGLDEQPVEINGALRAAVEAKLAELDRAWALYELTTSVPPRLPNDAKHWNCRPRGDLNTEEGRKGMYCQFRTACYAAPA